MVEQSQYNMFNRHLLEDQLLPVFEAPYSLGTTTFSALDNGVLTGKYVKEIPKDSRLGGNNALGNGFFGGQKWIGNKNEKVEKLMEVAKEMGVSMVSLALAWVIKNKNVSVCMLGGTKAHQLEQNMDAIATAIKLDAETLEKIEKILGNKPGFTYGSFGNAPSRQQKYITNPIVRNNTKQGGFW